MKRKIQLLVYPMIALAILSTTVLLFLPLSSDTQNDVWEGLITETQCIAAAVELSGIDYLETLGPLEEGKRIRLINLDGAALFDSAGMPPGMEDHLDKPEIRAAFETGAGESIRLSQAFGEQTCNRAVRLSGGSVLCISKTTKSVFLSAFRPAAIGLLLCVVFFFAAHYAIRRVVQSILRPLSPLHLGALEEGDGVDEEFAPLLSRLTRQRDSIALQMASLRKEQVEFQVITNNMREGFLILDKGAQVLSFNKSALRLLHAPLENPSQHNVLALNRSQAFYGAVDAALHGNAADATLLIAGRCLQMIANPVRDDGNVQGAVVVLMDVTEQADRERLRREFTANVSHELKTPLTAISGYAEIIMNGIAKQEDTPRFAKSIYQEAQRLIRLIGDIMTLSRLDEGKASLPFEPTDLYALAEEHIDRMRDTAGRRGIALRMEGAHVSVWGIPQMLGEMLYNLLENAVKYNVEGGDVRVSVARDAGGVLLTIADTGIGIPKEDQERVFERFYRVDKSRNEAVEGTGLGLSIVKHAAMLHSAKIALDSDGKSGVTVRVKFSTEA